MHCTVGNMGALVTALGSPAPSSSVNSWAVPSVASSSFCTPPAALTWVRNQRRDMSEVSTPNVDLYIVQCRFSNYN